MKLRTMLAAALLLASLAPAAVAQVPGPSANAKVSIADLPPGPATVPAGASHNVPFTVQLTADGFQCTSASSVAIDLAVSNAGAAPPGVTVAVDPPNATIAIPVGVYANLVPGLPVAPFNGSAQATLKITIAPTAASGSFKASVTATLKSVQPNGCVGTLPDSQDSKTHEVSIQGSAAGNQTMPPPTGGNATGNQTTPPPPPAKSPGFELLALAPAVAAAALLLRRRD